MNAAIPTAQIFIKIANGPAIKDFLYKKTEKRLGVASPQAHPVAHIDRYRPMVSHWLAAILGM